MSATPQCSGVEQKRWTKKEYYRLGELGFFDGQRVELIEGQLMVHSPQNSLHADTLDEVKDVLRSLFGAGYLVRSQLPIDLGQPTEPEPDVAVVVGRRRQYRNAHPTSAVLIVEVADGSLDYDLSGLTPVRFEFRPKDTQLNLRLPEALLDQVKARAKKRGIPYTRLIRLILEQAVSRA